MIKDVGREGLIAPVTALHILPAFILVGQGPFLKIFVPTPSKPISQFRVFESASIHGIIPCGKSSTGHQRILVWGGCLICLLQLQEHRKRNRDVVKIKLIGRAQSPDWIISAAAPCQLLGTEVSAALLTAKNVLFQLQLKGEQLVLAEIGSTVNCILYSAHVTWNGFNKLYIAAGTVFGEIILWSCTANSSNESGVVKSWRSTIHYRLRGHEGAVFGVHLSEDLQLRDNITIRLLASCSDDRVVRIWDVSKLSLGSETISDTTFDEKSISEPDESLPTGLPATASDSEHCIAHAWGHLSRIWGARFGHSSIEPNGSAFSIFLVSYGEDARCQLWELNADVSETCSVNTSVLKTCTLEKLTLYRFNSGRNIWSLGVQISSITSTTLLALGGADGRVSFTPLEFSGQFGFYNQEQVWDMRAIQCATHERSIYIGRRGDSKDNLSSLPAQSEDRLHVSQLFQNGPQPDSFKSYFILDELCHLAVSRNGSLLVHNASSVSKFDTSSLGYKSGWTKLNVSESLGRIAVSHFNKQSKSLFIISESQSLYCLNFTHSTLWKLAEIGMSTAKIVSCSADDKDPSYLAHDKSKDPITTSAQSLSAGVVLLLTFFQTSSAVLFFVEHQDGDLQPPSVVKVTISLDRTFLASSVLYIPFRSLLILGSKGGELRFYDVSKMPVSGIRLSEIPTENNEQVHHDNINTLIYAARRDEEVQIVTISDDGSYAVIAHNSVEVPSLVRKGAIRRVDNYCRLLYHSSPKVVLAVKGGYFDPSNRYLMLYGFDGHEFVVWNETVQVEHMRHNMRGVRSSFDFREFYMDDFWTGQLAYTFQRDHVSVNMLGRTSWILQEVSLGRDVKALAARNETIMANSRSDGSVILACGSEDCIIQLAKWKSPDIEIFGTFKRHNTGVQHLEWTPCKNFLVSCGGHGELFVWKYEDSSVLGPGLIFQAELDAEAGGHPSDVRIMSVALDSCTLKEPAGSSFYVTLVTSTSVIEIWRFDTVPKAFVRLSQCHYTSSAITQVETRLSGYNKFVLVAATDGCLVLYRAPYLRCGDASIDKSIEGDIDSSSDESSEMSSDIFADVSSDWYREAQLKCHQSAIKALHLHDIKNRRYLAISAGDDNAISVSLVNVTSDMALSQMCYKVDAHAAAINCITTIDRRHQFHNNDFMQHIRIVSAGNDSIVKIWQFGRESKRSKHHFELVHEVRSDIDDIASMARVKISSRNSDKKTVLFISGVGMEALSLPNLD